MKLNIFEIFFLENLQKGPHVRLSPSRRDNGRVFLIPTSTDFEGFVSIAIVLH
jgi:hypothetical protein